MTFGKLKNSKELGTGKTPSSPASEATLFICAGGQDKVGHKKIPAYTTSGTALRLLTFALLA